MLETKTPEQLLHTRQKGKGKEKAKETGKWLSKFWSALPETKPLLLATSHGRHKEEEDCSKYFWGRSLAHFGSLLAAAGQPAHGSSKLQNAVNPNLGN